jgi:hypothetical protein
MVGMIEQDSAAAPQTERDDVAMSREIFEKLERPQDARARRRAKRPQARGIVKAQDIGHDNVRA